VSSTPATPQEETAAKGKGAKAQVRNESSALRQKLEAIGLRCVAWAGKCEGDKVSIGNYHVPENEGGMYGLVFDNTFSKQLSKTANFVLMTYPTNAPPKSGHHLHFSQASSTTSLSAQGSPALTAVPSHDSLSPEITNALKTVASDPRPRSDHAREDASFGGSSFYTGVLLKRRRKHRNFARRFFSLDFTSSTLSYYQNRHSSALRGSIPLSLAVVSTSPKSREIIIDSGAELWYLKAMNERDFTGWRDALERASNVATSQRSASPIVGKGESSRQPSAPDPVEDRHWQRVQSLLSQISGVRDAVRRLAQDTDPKYMPLSANLSHVNTQGTNVSPVASPSLSEVEPSDYFDEKSLERPSRFWKRKTSSQNVSPAGLFRRSVSAQLAVPSPSSLPPMPTTNGSSPMQKSASQGHTHDSRDQGVHENCMAIMRNLDQVVEAFAVLISESKSHRLSRQVTTRSRRSSVDSESSEEFFDAQDGATIKSGLLTFQGSDGTSEKEDFESIVSGSESSEYEFEERGSLTRRPREGQGSLFPAKAKSLIPLPLSPVRRRRDVPPPKVPPPSLISFLRKNVGKDLSTIATPVSANEPLSMLQRCAEQLEYSQLLDAASASPDHTQRLLYMAAFAISNFSSNRVKERAMRKPFNPMLGETFELVREDRGFRLIAEKVSHRPVRLACQAESKDWTFLQSPMPLQKFWGKSAEINTDGRVRVFLHSVGSNGELYSWTQATSFLRNVIAGEKYIEPVATMTVVNEMTGASALITFKAGGMFSGRSEEVSVQVLDNHGAGTGVGLAGKWTTSLDITEAGAATGKTIWTVGGLVDNASHKYGFTSFAATLNEITEIEADHLPPTDSRLRPDQRAFEDGEVDRAEGLKARLEERQRARRKVMEEHGDQWVPKWFVKAGMEGEDEIWRLKSGKESYWEARARGDWIGVIDVFN
jgi:hypothetical protein